MKTKLTFFAVVIMALAIPQSVKAYDFSYTYQGQTLYYNIVDGSAQVTYRLYGYSNYSNAVAIPNSVTHNGISYSVTAIGNQAFCNCSGLTSVTIPNSVTIIGEWAFYGCNSLTSVSIPNSVTSIGESAFSGCSGLTSVTIPNSVTSISQWAFSGCSGLTSVAFNADSCTTIWSQYNNRTFYGCTNITNFTFGNNVKVIPSGLCYGLSGLTSVIIPNSVTSIGEGAFYNCSGLISVTFNADSCTSAGTLYNIAFYGCTNITNFTFGDNVKIIPDYLCYNLSGLTSVTIGDSVTSIGNAAFLNCRNLTTVTIPNTVTSIGDGAFFGCCGLTSVTIPNSVISIGENAFYGCSGLTSVTIPNSVTSIGRWGFSDCDGLTSVSIPNSVTFIDEGAFSNCSDLISVTIGNSVTSIGNEVFVGCSGLDTIYMLPETAPGLGYHCFYSDSDVEVNIPRVFYIPCGSYYSYYYGSGWFPYQTVLQELVVGYALSLGVNDSIKGVASIVQQNERDVACDSSVIIRAIASYGYHFDHWSNGNMANPDTLYLVSDSTITAMFAPNQYTLIVASSDYGTVSGSGTYDFGDSVTIQAYPEEHYHFTQWNDGNTENPRVVTVTGDITYTAYFESMTQGIATIDAAKITIYTSEGHIVVSGAKGMEMRVFDVVGREVIRPTRSGETPVLPRGVYLVNVDTLPARKIVVVR